MISFFVCKLISFVRSMLYIKKLNNSNKLDVNTLALVNQLPDWMNHQVVAEIVGGKSSSFLSAFSWSG